MSTKINSEQIIEMADQLYTIMMVANTDEAYALSSPGALYGDAAIALRNMLRTFHNDGIAGRDHSFADTIYSFMVNDGMGARQAIVEACGQVIDGLAASEKVSTFSIDQQVIYTDPRGTEHPGLIVSVVAQDEGNYGVWLSEKDITIGVSVNELDAR